MTLPRDASPPPPRRCLWKSPGSVANDSNATPRGADDDDHGGGETYDSLYRRCASLGRLKQPRTFPRLCSNAVVVVQEFALTSFFLARIGIAMKVGKEGALRGGRFSSHLIQNQQQQLYSDASTAGLYLTLGIVVFYSARADQSQQQHRVTKATQRTADAALLAVWLRFTAAVVQSLTASYSSDTVQILAMFGMLVHLLCCDYSYANGRTAGAAAAAGDDGNAMAFSARRHRRPPFRGGTVSLNAALFATTLLVSRLSSRDSLAFVFVSLAVVFFSFYPVTRHAISVSYPSSVSGMCIPVRDTLE